MILERAGIAVYAGQIDPAGRYHEMDGADAAAILRGHRGEGAGRSPDERLPLIHPDDRAAVARALDSRSEGVSTAVEYRLLAGDGGERWVLDRARSVARADGGIDVSGVAIDLGDRREATAELREVRALLGDVVRDQRVHVYRGILGTDGSYVETHAGPGAEGLLGGELPPGVEKGQAWMDCLHRDDIAVNATAVQASFASGEYEAEYRLIGYDGVVRWVWDRGRVVSLGAGKYRIEGLVTDVTARRAVEEELRGAHEQLAAILHESRAHVFQAEILATGGYGSVFVGPGSEHLLGVALPTDTDVDAGAFWRDRVHPDDLALYDAGVERQVHGEATDLEYRLAGLDGVERRVWEHTWTRPRPDGSHVITGFVADISMRHAAAEELRAAHERLALILDAVGQAVYTNDLTNEATTYSAGRWDALLGAEPGEDVARELLACVHPADRTAYLAGRATLASGDHWSGRYRLVSHDGALRWVSERATVRRSPAGGLVVDGSLTDVTAEQTAAAALADTRDRLARIVESVEEFLFTLAVTADGSFEPVYLGPGFDRLLGGVPPAGVDVREAWGSRLHRDDAPAFLAYLEELLVAGEAEIEVRVVGYDRTVRWTWIRARTRGVGATLMVDGIISDVTARRLAEEELSRAWSVDSLTGAADRRHFVAVADVSLGARGGGLLLIDVDHFKRVNDVYGHAAGDAVLVEVVRRMTVAAGPDATVARWGGEEFAIAVPAGDEAELRSIATDVCRAVGSTPVELPIGALTVTVSCGAVLADGRRGLDELTAGADSALYAAKRRGRNRACVESELVDADRVAEAPEPIRIAEAMARATAFREGVPERHCHEVARLAAALAEHLRLPPETQLRARMGGYLHDVGKIAIPDRILTKPGALDAEEWATMQTHTTIGRDLVLVTPGLADAAPVVEHHHERWDGRGYPAGLAGERIPVEARIVGVADAWCAMIEDRVYRVGMARSEALAEIRRSAGSQFDPAIVLALLAVVGERDDVIADAA